MDERTLFDRFHEALDIEPRPGAYERLRTELTRQPVALRRRPAFRMRFSKMGLRMAAALAAVLIAIVLIATFVAVHYQQVGENPAGTQNLNAYRAMITADYNAMDASTSDHCNSLDDTGCAAAVQRVDAALRRWISDLTAFRTPAQFVALDAILRAHLQDGIDDLDSAVGFQRQGDVAGFTLAMNAAYYERAFYDPVTRGLEGTATGTGNSYSDALDLARASVNECVMPNAIPSCQRLQTSLQLFGPCAAVNSGQCESDIESLQTTIATVLINMAQHAAPASLAAHYSRAEADLVQVYAALIAFHQAVLHGASTKAAEDSLISALMATQTGLSTIN